MTDEHIPYKRTSQTETAIAAELIVGHDGKVYRERSKTLLCSTFQLSHNSSSGQFSVMEAYRF